MSTKRSNRQAHALARAAGPAIETLNKQLAQARQERAWANAAVMVLANTLSTPSHRLLSWVRRLLGMQDMLPKPFQEMIATGRREGCEIPGMEEVLTGRVSAQTKARVMASSKAAASASASEVASGPPSAPPVPSPSEPQTPAPVVAVTEPKAASDPQDNG